MSERERNDHINMSLGSVTGDMEESPATAVLNSESAQLPLTSLIVPEHAHNDVGHLLHTPAASVTLPNSSSSPPPLASVTEHTGSLSATGTMCIVCGDIAPKDTTFRRHYGVVCCEACKCFFRRTVQMSRDYKCRYGNTCSIGRNPVSMKQVCQACRFNQCIKAGMKLESVKRFPRKGREDRKYHKELKLGKEKEKGIHGQKKTKSAKDSGGRTEEIATINGTARGSPADNIKTERGESDAELETDLEHLKFGVASPESFMYSVLDSAVPQLFNYDSLENIHERSGGGTGGSPLRGTGEGSRTGSNSNLAHGSSVPRLVKASSSGSINKKVPGEEGAEGERLSKRSVPHELQNALQLQGKKMKLESALSVISPRQPIASYSSSSSAPPSRSQSLSQPPSVVNSPESMVGNTSAYNSQETTPYATPIGTPAHSPLPSPTHTHAQHPHHHVPHLIQKFPQSSVFSTSPGDTLPGHMTHRVSATSFATPTLPALSQPSNSFLLHGQTNTGTIFLNHPSQMPFRVLPVAGVATHPPLMPLVQFAPFSQQALATDVELTRQDVSPTFKKSPFTIIPIPSVNRAQPEEPEVFTSLIIPQDRDAPRAGDCEDVGMMSAPPSARASPEPREPVHRTRSLAAMPEAELEEVLDSLRLRIRSMFKWAKSEVAGFEDLSPLDQKALLRRTVAELVMLGFARGSIAYDDMLLLGRTDKVIRATNPNTGVASVASVTLQKLVVPLKVLNINDRELTLLKEIVLFNPESTGLRNREVVRQYRKRKHIELMEYTVKNSGEPGRFGELMCLLTPLFEVSTEVTEQLRLEQFVYEGEARIDALLLMSMINGAEETTESVADA